MGKSRDRQNDAEGSGGSKIESTLDDEVDALFKLPLAGFIDARKDLAARLKRDGRSDDAILVKALAKPSVSAWAVNQLHWNHREEFDQLLAASRRFLQAQASRAAGTMADMRGPTEARREALSRLAELAAGLLRDAGYNPTPDTIHRITTTLEAVSPYASLPDSPAPGRLTRDLEPLGFEALALLMADANTTKATLEPEPVTLPQESADAATEARPKASPDGDVQNARKLEDARQARIAAAKASLLDAERSLTEARARAERLEAAETKAIAEANQAQKELRESEERLKKASAAARDAAERSRSIAAEAKEAARAVKEAGQNVEKASKEVELLLRESATR